MKKMLSLTLAVVMILGLMVPMNAFASNEITVTVNFDESLNQDQSKVIMLPNLGEIKSVTSNTGSVSHSINGDNVTLNASGGTPSRSEQIMVNKEGWLTETKTQVANTSFVSSYLSNDSAGNQIPFYKDGSHYLVSGQYLSADSKFTAISVVRYNDYYAKTDAYGWWSGGYSSTVRYTSSKYGGILNNSVNPFYYNYEGYAGSLTTEGGEEVSDVGYNPPTTPNTTFLVRRTGYQQIYQGTISRPATDTRTYMQNYKGYGVVGQEQSTQNYYSYSVEITYTLNYSVELGAINGELDSMKQQIITRQVDDKLNEFSARNQVLKQNLNAMPNETDVNVVKQKALQLDKVISAMKSIVNLEKGSTTEDVFSTSNVINQIEDPVLKEQLQSQLSQVSDVSSIVRAIQKAEVTFATGDIKKAMAVVKQLDNDHPQKANLVAQIETVRNAFNDALTSKQKESIKKDALYFVAQTEQFGSVFYLNRAKTLVEQLGTIDNALQSELQARLTSASGKVTSNSSFIESLAKRQLEMAEIHRHPALIAQAQNSISLVKNDTIRAEYMQRLEQLK